jgi:diguanylate cyclase (GGDEF)-like protein
VTLPGLALLARIAQSVHPAEIPAALSSPVLWAFAVFLVPCELWPVEVPLPAGTEEMKTSAAFGYAILLTSGARAAIGAMVVVAVLGGLVRRRGIWWTTFDVAHYALALAMTAFVVSAGSGAPRALGDVQVDAGTIGPILAGAGILFVTVHGVNAILTALRNGLSPFAYMSRDFSFQASTAGVLMALSPMAVVAAHSNLIVVPLLGLPLYSVYKSASSSLGRERDALHDSLTGLPNRTLFLDRVEHAVARSRRQGTSIAVLFLDLDGFKAVNDRFGHAAGDDLLNTVAQRLVSCVREADSVARLGGDEFAVLLEDVGRPEDVEELAGRILAALRSEIVIAGHDVVVGTSIGVAIAAPDDDASGLLRDADMAMYRAKALGKDRFFVYQPSLREENIRRLELIEALRRGIAEELVVHYQPVVDLENDRIDGVEALVRWQRGDTLVLPDAFIHAAEESGLIVELGERVLAQVVADAQILVEAAGHPLNIGVNMSAHQLREPSFADAVRRAVAALGDSRLVLEMTETVVVQDDEESAAMLRQLKALGAMLAIDDFGVGFSSIGYLQHLPVDIIKIDRTFTRDIDSDPRAAALVEAILLMGSALNLSVVAEGIERQTQVQRLRGSGCLIGQGFLFASAEPLSVAVGTLRDWAIGRAAPYAGSSVV